jgi:hypothetical protein
MEVIDNVELVVEGFGVVCVVSHQRLVCSRGLIGFRLRFRYRASINFGLSNDKFFHQEGEDV